MLARYNPENGVKFFWNKSNDSGWKNPFGNINWNGNIKASVMPELAGLDKITSVEIMSKSLEELVENYGLAEGAGLDYIRSVQNGSVNLKVGETAFQGYQRCLVETSVKTKALTLATKALSTIAWAAVITTLITLLSKLGEYLHSFTAEGHIEKLGQIKSEYDEITSKIKSLNDEFKTTKDRIQELEGKGNLTFTEQEELDKLKAKNAELERSAFLYNAEQRIKDKQKRTEFVETVEVLHGEDMHGADVDYSRADFLQDTVAQYKNIKDEIAEATTIEEKERLEEDLFVIEQRLVDHSRRLSEIADGIEYIPNPTTDDERAVNETLDFINNWRLKVAILMGENGAKTSAFDFVINKDKYAEVKDELDRLGGSGQLTAEKVAELIPVNSELYNELVDLGVIVADDTNWCSGLAYEFSVLKTKTNEAEEGITSLTSSLSALKQAGDDLKVLSAAFDEFTEDGVISIDTLSQINEKFGKIDGIEDYINRLSASGVTAKEVQQILGELTIAKIRDRVVSGDLRDATESQIAQMLREANITNANALAHELVAQSKVKEILQTRIANGEIETIIKNLAAEASQCGLTESAFESLILSLITAENTTLTFDEQIAALHNLGYAASLAWQQVNGKNVPTMLTESGIRRAVDDTKTEVINGKKYITYYDTHGGVIKREYVEDKNLTNTTPEYEVAENKIADARKSMEKTIASAEKDLAEQEKQFAENMAEAYKKDHLEALKENLAERKDILSRYAKQLEVIDFGEGLIEEHDFSTKMDLASSKFDTLKEQGNALRAEFEHIKNIMPQTGEEATVLADRLTELGSELRSNVTNLREVIHEIDMLRISAIQFSGQNILDEYNREIDMLERRLDALSSKNKGKFTSQLIDVESIFPTLSEFEQPLYEKRKADKALIKQEQETQDEINAIVTKALKQQNADNAAARAKERAKLIEDIEKARAEAKEKIDEAYADFEKSTANTAQAIQDTFNEIKIKAPDTTEFKAELDDAVEYAKEKAKQINDAMFAHRSDTYSGDGRSPGAYKFVEHAKGFSGSKYGDVKNKNTGDAMSIENYGAWCAEFISDVARQLGISTDVIPQTAAVQGMLDFFKGQGRYYVNDGKFTPQVGDIGIAKNGKTSHVAIVTGYDGGYVYTIEGNTSNPSAGSWSKNNSWSMEKKRNLLYFTGFGRPNYGSYANGGITSEDYSLVGEEGREIGVLPNGKIVMFGQNGAELLKLPIGTEIIPNADTESILKASNNQLTNKDVNAFANGTKNKDKYIKLFTDTNLESVIKELLSPYKSNQEVFDLYYLREKADTEERILNAPDMSDTEKSRLFNDLKERQLIGYKPLGIDGLGMSAVKIYNELAKAYNVWLELVNDGTIEASEESINKWAETLTDAYDEVSKADSIQQDIFEFHENNLNNAVDSINRFYNEYSGNIEKLNKELEKVISQENAHLSILTKQFDTINKLSEAQHNADKTIAESRISKEYLNPSEYALIYNESDYTKITSKIKTLRRDIDDIVADFGKQIDDAYYNDQVYLIETITTECERQLELKMKELEIAEVELEVTKKETQLRNVLAERNVRQMIEKDGKMQWVWVADVESVRSATEEAAEAIYQLGATQEQHSQQAILDMKQNHIDDLTDSTNANNAKVEALGRTVDDIKAELDKLINPASSLSVAFNVLETVGVPALTDAVNGFISVVSKIANEHYGDVVAPNGIKVRANADGKARKGLPIGTTVMTNGGDYLITAVNPDGSYESTKLIGYERNNGNSLGDMVNVPKENVSTTIKRPPPNTIDAIAEPIKEVVSDTAEQIEKSISPAMQLMKNFGKSGYASGTQNATRGLHKVNEYGGETYISKEGTFHNFEGGEYVFDTEQTRNLWELSNKFSSMFDISKVDLPVHSAARDVKELFKTDVPQVVQNIENISKPIEYNYNGDIIVQNPADFNGFVKELKKSFQKKSV